jgi:hypothetical protein
VEVAALLHYSIAAAVINKELPKEEKKKRIHY